MYDTVIRKAEITVQLISMVVKMEFRASIQFIYFNYSMICSALRLYYISYNV